MKRLSLHVAAGAIAGCLLLTAVTACVAQRQPAESVAVRQDYLAYWQSLIAANSVPNPGSPRLAQHTASTQLALLRHNLTIDVRTHIYAAGSVSHHIRSVTVHGMIAYVVDCVNLDNWLLYRQHTRTLIPQLMKRPRQLALFTLAEDGRTWKVTKSFVYGQC
jgi:hypothetical protein